MPDDVQLLLDVLPTEVVRHITDKNSLTEIVLDLGRPLEIRYGSRIETYENFIIDKKLIDLFVDYVGDFGFDNRAGIDGTLHRISRIQNRYEDIIGLTCRVGKPFYGSAEVIKDIIDTGLNILLLGAPGRGKTTKLRDTARYLSSIKNKKVIVIDTSNEIAGDSNIAHEAIGKSRRMQVPFCKTQHSIMIEAVENHTPEVIIIDEISTIQEAQAARSIAQRGVQLIATAHGKQLIDLLNNPPLSDLVGGINIVTLSDDSAKRRGLSSKTIQERKNDPTFDVVIELIDFEILAIHSNVQESVDAILAGGICIPEERRILGGVPKVVREEKIVFPKEDKVEELQQVNELNGRLPKISRNGIKVLSKNSNKI